MPIQPDRQDKTKKILLKPILYLSQYFSYKKPSEGSLTSLILTIITTSGNWDFTYIISELPFEPVA
jgi:hypothetical protein